jgi:adenylate cyclase
MPIQRHRPAASTLVKLPLHSDLGGVRPASITSATVLFVDLRGYTGIAERFPAASVARLLEEFFGILSQAIDSHGGQIYHIAGDGMMAGFGLHGGGAQGAADAMAAARDMLAAFAPMALRWRDELHIDTGIGVGIHQGEVALGCLGPSGRQTTTLVGDTVNVAARLCNRARAGEVLFSAVVAAAFEADTAGPTAAEFLRLPQFALRGRSRPLDIWCVPAGERVAIGTIP